MFLHRNSHKDTWTSADEKTHNQIDHVLINRRRNSNVVNVQSFEELIVILTVMWWLRKFDRDYFFVNKRCRTFIWSELIPKNDDVVFKEQYQVEISNRLAGLENLDDDDDVSVGLEKESEGI